MSVLNFTPNLTGFQLTNPDATTYYTFNNFKVETNISPSSTGKTYSNAYGDFSSFTLESLGLESVDKSKELLSNNLSVFLNIDRTNLGNYAYFGSLRERFNYGIKKIIAQFPGSIFVSPIINSQTKLNVLDYNYNNSTNITYFKVPVSCFINKFGLLYNKTTFTGTTADTKDIGVNYKNYTIFFDSQEYPILEFTGTTSDSKSYVYLTCSGQPFLNYVSGGSVSVLTASYHIKPKSYYLENFINSLDELEAYFLNRETAPIYTSKFNVIREAESGKLLSYDLSFTWPVTDGYNIDIDTPIYALFLNNLLDIAKEYDDYKASLITRFLTSSDLIMYDTEDNRYYSLLQSFGYQFDKIKVLIDSLIFCNKISYDKKENISDILIKNLATTLGWSPLTNFSSENLINSFLQPDSKFNVNQVKTYTPAEIDIELWRRLIINTGWLFRSKGTRKSIMFILNMLGIEDTAYEINEFVYVTNKLSEITGNTPVTVARDSLGYPKILNEGSSYYFQSKGGWNKQIEIIDDNNLAVGAHIGDYDYGMDYFNPFRNTGFTLDLKVDNKKSWVRIETGTTSGTTRSETLSSMKTFYTAEDERQILNTKFLTVKVNLSDYMEKDIFNYFKVYNPTLKCDTKYVFDDYVNDGYSDCITIANEQIDFNNLTFAQFIDKMITRFVDVKNRKIVSDYKGGTYPTLRWFFEQYYSGNNSAKITYDTVLKYFDNLNPVWENLISQILPATTIWGGLGLTVKNNIFQTQKLTYRRGITRMSGGVPVVTGADNSSKFETIHVINTSGITPLYPAT